MSPVTQSEVNLFGSELPSLDEIKKLGLIINSSERNRLEFIGQLEENSRNGLAVGIGHYIVGQYAESAKKLEKAGSSMEKDLFLGYALRKLGDYDKAVNSFESAGKNGCDSLMVAMEKAATLRMAGKIKEAEKELKACSNFDHVSAEYHFQLGLIADAVGDYGEAISNYEIATELDPGHTNAIFRLAYACDLWGNDESAIDYYKQLIKITPSHVNGLLNLAVLYEDDGHYENALQCIEAVLKSHPNHKKAQLFKKDVESSETMIYDEEKELRQDRHNKILEIPISDFELSVRSRNCLKKMNISTLGDLLRIGETELLAYKNFGETSLQEIKKILDQKSLQLGMSLENTIFQTSNDLDEEASSELLGKTISELELSVRARRALSKLGIPTIGELVAKTEAELLGCKNFGVTSLNEIKERLTSYGLSLRRLE